MSSGSYPFIYHEKQVASLCGVHCVNTLLQGSYFTEVDLATVALQLDSQEKKLMMEMGTETTDFLKYMAEDSGNVADGGDYSVQVLEKVLADGWDLSVTPINASIVQNAINENAFICNLADHWFTIRKIGNKWYNLNSLLPHPQVLSDFYLSLYLDTLLNSKWSVFVVRGQLPPVTSNTICSEGGRWVTVAECVVQKPEQATNSKQSNDDKDLEAAIALSLAGSSLSVSPPTKKTRQIVEDNDDDAELQAALEASELDAAIAASLQRT